MDLWIMDLADLRFAWAPKRTGLSVYSPRGEILAVVPVKKNTSLEEAALAGFDAALGSAQVERVMPVVGRQRYGLGLYNPHTGEIAVGAIPRTRVFSSREPVVLGPDGLAATLEDGALHLGEVTLLEVTATSRSISRVVATYEDLVTA